MKRLVVYATFAVLALLPNSGVGQPGSPRSPVPSAQLDATFASDLAHVRRQIAEAERDLAAAPGGLLGELTRVRIGIYRLTESLLQHRAAVAVTGSEVPGVFGQPDAARVARAEADVAAARDRVAAATAQVGQTGGMIGVLALTTLATERQALALAELAAVSARQGLALAPSAASRGPDVPVTAPGSSAGSPGAGEQASDATRGRAFTPETQRAFERSGYRFEHDWAIRGTRSRMDDTPEVRVQTLAVEDFGSNRNPRSLIVACIEGDTRLYVDLQDFLQSDYRSHAVRVMYRIDQRPRVDTQWETSTTNQAAGLWGADAIPLIRALLDGEELVVRVIEQNNQQHQVTFSLKGFRTASQTVAEACRWSLQAPAPGPAQQQPRAPGPQRR